VGIEGTLTGGARGGWTAPATGRRRIAITGAGGFIGGALVEALVARGDEVLAIDLVPVEVPGVRSVVADIAADGPWVDAFVGCDLVIHTAAIVTEAGDRAHFEAVNVGGTRRVCEAAADADVDRVLHLSSVVVYGDRFPRGSRRDEDAPTAPTGGPYTDTKIAAEHAALASASERRSDLTIVRPGDVYGAGSIPWVRRPLELLRRGLFVLVDGGIWPLSPVYIDDLVTGILAAVDRDVARGRIYNLAGPPVRTREFFAHHADHVGRPMPSLPRPLARLAIQTIAAGAHLARTTPPISPEAIEYVTHPGGYATDRAARELGWTPQVPLADGLAASFAVLDAADAGRAW
jgi:2-alkyl-3-oxoalkanoate reductase